MANCEFLGLAKVRGTLSKSTIRTKQGTITRRFVACVRNGKQRVYLREDTPRSTPVTEREGAARQLFKERAAEVQRIMATEHLTKAEAWKRAKQSIPIPN